MGSGAVHCLIRISVVGAIGITVLTADTELTHSAIQTRGRAKILHVALTLTPLRPVAADE